MALQRVEMEAPSIAVHLAQLPVDQIGSWENLKLRTKHCHTRRLES